MPEFRNIKTKICRTSIGLLKYANFWNIPLILINNSLKIVFLLRKRGCRLNDFQSLKRQPPVFMYIYFMNLTLGYIAFLASSFLSLNTTLFCSKRLSPLASIDTIRGPNSLTLQHHNVSGIPSSSQ